MTRARRGETSATAIAVVALAVGVAGLAGAAWVSPALAAGAGAAGAIALAALAVLAPRAERAPPVVEPEPAPRAREPTDEELVQAGQLEALGMLAGGIAHDFNNLLVGILGNASLALGEVGDGPAKDALRDIEVAARRGRDLVAQILAYSGKGRLEARPLDVGAVVHETVAVLNRVISRSAKVELEAAEGSVVEADPAQLRQVLMNLLTNASDALGDAPGRIRVRVLAEDLDRATLDLTTYGRELPPGRYARIEVADNGCGMDPETARRIFEPFFTTKRTGRGLGLAALLGIVRNHRGTVQVESAPGVGTTFRVWLPLQEDLEADRTETPGGIARLDGTGTVLLAEDEDLVRRVSTRMLSKLGFEVVAVPDGASALLAAADEDVTLALVDVQMPGVDGRRVLEGIRERRPELPVVLMTGFAGPDPLDPGPDAWLRKPFSMRDLVAALEAARRVSRPSTGPSPSRSAS